MRLPIDGQAAKALTAAGLTWLRTNQESVNALNVFPVPDGDTGTNMVLTMQSAYNEVSESAERNIGKMVHALAHGALMGARGNSGVILSQIWRGFARAFDEAEVLDGPTIVSAFIEARDTAYRGVGRPVEGTILTVARDLATAAEEALAETEHPVLILEQVVTAAKISVDRTPDLLPVLKKAGVVDAGGMGLYLIFDGMQRHINGASLQTPSASIRPLHEIHYEESMEAIEPGQDYEVIVDFFPKDGRIGEEFFSLLDGMGTSIQIGEGDGLYRVHIHVPEGKRYEPIELAMSVGTVTKVAIENLVAQMSGLDRRPQPEKIALAPVTAGEIAAIAVAPGPGIAEVFASLGVAGIIEGGQSMNPNVKEILTAIENLPTDKIVVLPNNKNIILAAEGAAELTVKNVAVLHTRSVPQGIEAMLKFMPDGDFDEVVKRMNTALDEVISAEITTAVRDIEVDGVHVQEGQIIAILDGGTDRRLVCSTESLEETVVTVLHAAGAQDCELITLFYGQDVSPQQLEKVVGEIQEAFPDLEQVEVKDGGQPHYQFILMIE